MSTKVSQFRRAVSMAVAVACALAIAFGLIGHAPIAEAKARPKFRVLAFYTAKHDLAHISFVNEANRWFPLMAARHNFQWDSTKNWDDLNPETLRKYQVVMFLDTRPEEPHQRAAFQQFVERGGAFMGFHFAGFALTPSKYPQNWGWYHDDFLGVGQYKSNTWRPTSAVLRVENRSHPATAQLPETFKSSPNEWYRWEHDLRKKPNFDVLLSIDPTSFPLGTGPKQHEIWRSGDYPVVWTNTNYKMLYLNMGHNDIDYGKTNAELSFQFANHTQNRLVLDGLLWLGGVKRARPGKAAAKPLARATP
jgi:hypothetical protein